VSTPECPTGAKAADCHPGEPRPDYLADLPGRGRTVLFLAICCLGISAFMTQLTLMRELVSVFSGNELVYGIVLGNWLLLTGIGSALGKTAARLKRPVTALILAQILVAVLPLVDLFALRCLQNEAVQKALLGGRVLFIRGAEVGVTETVASCFVLLAPYCLTTGYLLTLACLVLTSEKRRASIGQVYFLDNIGDVLGGLLFTFVLVYLFEHFGILYFPALLNLVFAGLVAALFRRLILTVTAVVATAAMVAAVATCDLEELSTRIQYAGQHVVYRGNSPYGNLIVTEQARQYNFIENGVLLFSTHNLEQREETVHYAMAQRPHARRVLLISGGVSGTAREILKYGVAAVDYVELDPKIIEVARRYVPENLDDQRIHVFNTDGRLFVRQADVTQPEQRYDVAIVDVPEPLTFQINRFYTREFFREVRRVLAPDGVLAFSLGQYENYVSPELANLISVADRTLKQAYAHVLIIPGGKLFFLASDGELTLEVAERIERAGVATRRVSRDYLRATLTEDRLRDVRRPIGGTSAMPRRMGMSDEPPVNKDFSPILYYYRLRLWMSQFRVRFGLFEGALLVVLLVYLLRLRPVPLALCTTGFAASALEVVLVVGFQILYGGVYHQVGLIVTMFMLGLGIGSFAMNRMLLRPPIRKAEGGRRKAEPGAPPLPPSPFPLPPSPGQGGRPGRKDLAKLELAIAVYAVCLPLVLIGLGGLGGAAGYLLGAVASRVVIPLAALLLAVLVGLEFPLAGQVVLGGTNSRPAETTAWWRGMAAADTPHHRQAITSAAARLYTADYVGAALGALLVSTLLIPLAGVVAVCLLAAGLNFISGVVILVTARG
jgi:spermidine synthase